MKGPWRVLIGIEGRDAGDIPCLRALAVLFHPATALIGRLRYVQKFLVVGLVLLGPLGFVSFSFVSVQHGLIETTKREQLGLEYLREAVDFFGDVILARHVVVTSGHEDALGMTAEIAKMDAVDARIGASLDLRDEWRAVRVTVLNAIHSGKLAQSPQYDAYNRAVTGLELFMTTIGDRSKLVRDVDVESYYLTDILQARIPTLLDVALRSADRALIARPRATAESQYAIFVELGADQGVLTNTNAMIARGVAAVLANTSDETIRKTVAERFRALDEATTTMGERLTGAVRSRNLFGYPEFVANEVRLRATLFAGTLADALEQLLSERIARLTSRAQQVGVAAALAAALSGYLFVGFYRSVSTPIRRIVGVLRAVAQGDLTRRVVVTTRDELSFVGAALNETLAQTELAVERLEFQATRDPLTLLPNRVIVIERLDAALAEAKRSSSLLAVLFIDLDRFKVINDSLGHDAGDNVLREVAARLTATIRASDTVARLAGDEFVVIAERLIDEEEALRIAERVVEILGDPMAVSAGDSLRDVTVGASVGIAYANGESDVGSANLLRDADVAMYQAKQRGRGRLQVFDRSLRSGMERRHQLQQDLRRAIGANQFVVHYQPIVATATGELLGFEALVRWQHPTRGLLLPGEFIDIAEESGLIVPVGAEILASACRQAALWRAERPGCDRLHLAVNVSAAQFDHPAFVSTVASVLADTDLDPDALWLEITETCILADLDAAATTIAAIRSLGAHLAVDDFGTGYTSLTYLRRFPIEILKIDQSFVSGLGRVREDEAIVEMLINLADTLDLQVIAEGVETPQQLGSLRELRAGACQGYLFGRPQPADVALDASRASWTLGVGVAD
jgi:diguanylate cyclase (GGDEF)-like protein